MVRLAFGVLFAAGLVASPNAKADDALPFFTETGVAPDVLFVLDGSYAMLCESDTVNCPGAALLPLSSKDTSNTYLKKTRAYKTVTILKSIVNEFSPLGIRFGLAMTSYNTGPLASCKVGLSMVSLASNNAAAMSSGLDLYITRLRSISSVTSATKDQERVFDNADSLYRASISADINRNCRKRMVMFITGGGGSIRQDCMDGSAPKISSLYTLPTQPGVNAQGNIYTYVMGFNLISDIGNGYEKLQAMATAGHTTEPRSAQSSVEFTGIMQQILNNILAGTYTGCDPVINPTNDDLYLAYFRIYDPAAYPDNLSWEGHIANYPLDSAGQLQSLRWDVASALNARSVSSRKIYSSYDDGSTRYALSDFTSANVLQYYSGLSVTGFDINFDGLTGTQDDASTLINFMRGETSTRYYTLYAREPYRLLDILRSTPAYVSPPSAPSGDPDYYQVFQPAQETRPDLLIAGSNGGMIHAFQSSNNSPGNVRVPTATGPEQWAYVPQHLLAKLKDLWVWQAHPTFVDARGAIGDVKVRTSSVAPLAWRTVYVAGDGIYGDEVDCAAAYAGDASKLWNCGWYTGLDVSVKSGTGYFFSPLWEFVGDGDLMNARAEPAFGLVRVKIPSSSPAELKDVLFLPGMGTTISYNGNTACYSPLYVVDPGTGQAISKILLPYRTTSGCDPDSLRGIRARVVAVDTDNDLVDDRLYVGDMEGQLWRIDISSTNPADWTLSSKRTRIFYPSMYTETSSHYPLPVSSSVATTYTVNGDLLIYFGLGDAETLDDFGDPPPTGHFYVLQDNKAISSGSVRLYNQTGEFVFPSFQNGEVLAGEPELVAGVVYFTTYTHSTTDCSLGSGRLYGLNYLTGSPGLDTNGDGIMDSKYIELGYGIPSGVVIGNNRWYVTMNDGSLGGASGGLSSSGVDTRSATTVKPLMPYNWSEVTGR